MQNPAVTNRTLKRGPAWMCWLALLCFTGLSQASPAGDPQELAMLTWSDYMDPALLQDFKKKYGITVREIHYETDELRDDMLLATNGDGYDLMVCAGAAIQGYLRQGWLSPLHRENIPNMKHVDSRWISAFPETKGYGVPYFWGTLGIAYRKDKITQPVTSWRQIFQPHEALHRKIIMIKDSRDLIGMALKSLGYSSNSVDRQQLTEAEHLLLKQRPFVKAYSYASVNKGSSLVTGDAWMAMMFNGDALMLKEHHPDITYVVPEEGGNLWVDYLVVLSNSKKKPLAEKFINFLNEPARAKQLAEFVYYATPNKSAEKLLPKEFLNDPVIYPSEETINKSEYHQNFPPRVLKQRNGIFSRVIQ